MANKSGIYIKPKNRGKFNALKKRTGKSTEELTHSKNPLTRKRAVFAQNARKWHHEFGGQLLEYASGGGLSRKRDYGSSKKPYPSVKSKDFAGGGRSYPIPTKADAVDALRLAGLHGRSDVKAKVYRRYPELRKEYGGYIMEDSYPVKSIKRAYGGHLRQALYGADLTDNLSYIKPISRPLSTPKIPLVTGPQTQAPTTPTQQPKSGGIGIHAPTYVMPPADPTNPGDAAYSAVMSGVSMAGPVGGAIGTITSIGDAIGTPIKNWAEGTDEYGGLKSQKNADILGNVGALTNPFKAFTTTLGDKEATGREKRIATANLLLPGMASIFGFGRARSQRMDETGERKFAEAVQERAQTNYGNMLNKQIRGFAMGGPLISKYKGASHQGGGIPVDQNSNPVSKSGRPAIAEVEGDEVAWNGYVFSNKLKFKR